MARHHWKVFDDKSPRLDQFGVLFIAALVAVVALSMVDLSPTAADEVPWASLTVSGYVVILFMLSMSAAGVAQRWRRGANLALTIGYLATMLITVTTYEPAPGDHFRTSALWALLAVLVPIAVVRRIVLQPEVTIRTLLGAIAAYLLLAFSFFMIFLEIDAYEAGPFFEEEVGTTDFMYFSLVTITTLGYGDFSPTTNTGQLASVAEAVIGQIFLVTLVAALVSRFAAKPRTRPDAD